MLVPYSLRANNLYSFKYMEIPFHKYNDGVTLIMGYNADMDDDNGAGKSNIFKILYFSIWGEDTDGVSLSEIIHDHKEKEGFWSEFVFVDKSNGDKYKILRWRDIKKSDVLKNNGDPIKGTGIEFSINDKLFHDPSFKEKEVKPLIQKRLGMTPTLFKNSNFIKQNQKDHFLEANDTKKKEIITDLLDMVYLEKAFKLVKEDSKLIKDVLIKMESGLNIINQMIDDKLRTKKELELKEIEFNTTQNEIKNDITKKISLIEQEIKKLNDYKIKNGFLDDSSLKKDISSIQNKLDTIKKELQNEEFQNINQIVRSITDGIILKKTTSLNLVSEVKQIQTNLDKNKKELTIISNQPIQSLNNSKDIEQIILKLKDKKTIIEKELNEQSLKEKELESIMIEIKKETSQLDAIQSDLLLLEKDGVCSHCDQIIPLEKRSIHFKKLETDRIAIKTSIEKKEKMRDDVSSSINKAQILSQYDELNKLIQIEEKKHTEAYKKELELSQLRLRIEDLKKEHQTLEIQLKENKKKLKPLLDEIKSDESNLKKYEAVQSKYTLINQNVQSLSEELLIKSVQLKEIENKNSFFSKIDTNIEQLEYKKQQLNESINNLKDKTNPFLNLIKDKNIEIAGLKKELNKKKNEFESKKEEFKYLDFCKKAFSPTGIRTYILYDLIEQLNSETQRFLDYSSNGTIHIGFELNEDTTNLDNKISQKIYIDGILRNSLLNSGGEFGRGILSVNLALGKLAESRMSGIPFNFQFLDESLKNFSEKGEEVAFSLFQKLSEEKNGLFVITHNKKMQNFANHYIYVVKKNRVSKIVDAETYNKEKNKGNGF